MTESEPRGHAAADREHGAGTDGQHEALEIAGTPRNVHREALSHIGACRECRSKLFMLFAEALDLETDVDDPAQLLAG